MEGSNENSNNELREVIWRPVQVRVISLETPISLEPNVFGTGSPPQYLKCRRNASGDIAWREESEDIAEAAL